MADNDLKGFKSAFEGIKAELGNLKENIASISQCIEASQLISDDMVQALSDVLVRYKEQYTALRDAGDRISISIGVDINEIENSIQVYEESQVSKQLRDVVLDYFRLSAESARVRTSLEESKRQLMEKCLLPTSDFAGEIHAYEIVVENAKAPRPELPEDEYKLLEDTFGSRIADASDNHLLVIDEAADLDGYLNGSCPLLMPINAELSGNSQSGTEIDAENKLTSNDESQETSQTVDKEKGTLPLWDDFCGYIDDVTYNMADNGSKEALTLEDIHTLTEEHYEFPYVLSTLANEKLLIPFEDVCAQRYDYVPIPQFVELLSENGLVTTVEINFAGKTKRYLTLTNNGWDCFRNADIHNAVSSKASYYTVPEHVQVCEWTNASLYRTAAICEFMNAAETRGPVIHAEDSSFVFAYANNVNGVGSMISTALFESGDELPGLAWLKTVAMSCKESAVSSFIILVSDKNDITKVNAALMLPDEIQTLVKYTVIGEDLKFYDQTGQQINCDTEADENTEDRSGEEMPDQDTTTIKLNPRLPIKAVNKLPSKQDFDLMFKRYSPVSAFVFNLLPIALMLTEQQMLTEIDDGHDDINVALLHELENKGYIGSYEYEGTVYYVASRLMAECVKKDQLRRVFKTRYPKLSDLCHPIILVTADVPIETFQRYVDLSAIYWRIHQKIMSDTELQRLLRSTVWDNVNERHYQILHKKDKTTQKLLMVSDEEFVAVNTDDAKGIICVADKLPALQATTPDVYYCLTDTLYVWDGLHWISVLDGSSVDPNTSDKLSEEQQGDSFAPNPENDNFGGISVESDDDVVATIDTEDKSEFIEHADNGKPSQSIDSTAAVSMVSDDEAVDLEHLLGLEAPAIAHYLLEKNITPESTDAYLLLVEKLVEASIVTSTKDVVVNTLSQAIALLKALSSTDPVYLLSYQRVLLAMDSKIQHHTYTGSVLNSVFTGNLPGALAHPVLKLMAYIRAMFTHDTAYDYELNSMAKGIFDYYEDNFPGLEILKPLYNSLLKVSKYLPAGFAMPILRRFGDEKAQKEQMQQINQRAKELAQIPTVKSGLGAMVPMLKHCFGPESDFYSCMEAISSNDLGYREVVRLVFEDFCEADSSGELVLSDSRIDKMFEDNWKKAIEEIHGPRTPFVSQKNKVTDNIRERLDLMDQWLQATSADERTVSNWSHIQSLRVEIMAELDRVDRELTAHTFEAAIIRAGIGKIRKKLQGRFVSDSLEFADMLRTGVFCLDDRGIPFMDDTYANVRYYEPWRNMLRHIAAPVESFLAVLDGITDNTNLRLFDNFGQAIQICNYLNTHCEMNLSIDEYQQDIERGKKKAQSDAEKFKGELEMAFAYGRIIEQFKEYMQGVLEHAVDSFSSFHNYACLRNLIIALRRMIDDEASSAVKRLTKEIEERMATQPEEKLLRMLEMAREKLDEPERNYAVAEEYINRYDAGVSDCLGLAEEDSNNAFLRFVNDEIDKLYGLCSKNGNYALRQFGAEYVTKALEKKKMSAQYKDSALTLVRSMPNRPDEIKGGETIANLLREIGFDVMSVRKTHSASSGNQIVRLSVDVRPDAKDKSEYPHPVDIMGTKLGSPLDVVCLFGKMQPNDIVDKVCKLELNRTAIVLLNGPFDVAARRQMAERFHREKSGRNPFLLVDWVLLLYLATYQRTERMAVMLSCTLPYTSSFKPFVIKGAVPDEMFIGRKSELNRILDPNGPCIVYGGRQLGKTALLERALSLANHSDRREYAVLVRAAAISTETDLVSALVMELNSHKLGIPTATSTMSELCMSLRQKYEEGKWTKILAMVDEADIVLSNFRAMNPVYKPIIPLSDLCRSTGNSFKFVLAGLHNVCRAASDPNTIFGQLGGALCIKPLNASDAYELLSRPLRYMGFKIAPDKLEHILVNTSFYPGIIHHVGYSLVENLSTKYSEYYSAARGNPPYELTDKQLGEIMSGDALNEKINERIRWTLEVDPRYFMIARCIAYLDCEDPGENNQSHSVDLIMEYAELLGISSLAGLDKSDYEGLLKELEDMGILVSQNEQTYRLRQRRFLEAIGNTCKKIEDDIQKTEGV